MLKTQRTVHTKTYNGTQEIYHSLRKGGANVAMRKQKTGASLQKEGNLTVFEGWRQEIGEQTIVDQQQ